MTPLPPFLILRGIQQHSLFRSRLGWIIRLLPEDDEVVWSVGGPVPADVVCPLPRVHLNCVEVVVPCLYPHRFLPSKVHVPKRDCYHYCHNLYQCGLLSQNHWDRQFHHHFKSELHIFINSLIICMKENDPSPVQGLLNALNCEGLDMWEIQISKYDKNKYIK